MQEVMVALFCDSCYLANQGKVEAVTVEEVRLGGLHGRVELCGDCEKAVLGPLRELLAAVEKREQLAAQIREKAERDARKVTYRAQCDRCTNWVELRARSIHASNVHGVDATVILWAYDKDVERVVLCKCGLDFPTMRGRVAHIRHYNSLDGQQGKHSEVEGTAEPRRPVK